MSGINFNVTAKMDILAQKQLNDCLNNIKNSLKYKTKYWLLIVDMKLNQSNKLNAFDLTISPEFKLAIPFTNHANLDEYIINNKELLMNEEYIIIEN